MGCRANRIASFRDHTCARHIGTDFFTGQVPADPRFCTLPDLDLNGSTTFEIIDIHPESPARNLDNHIFLVRVERFVESAFTRPHESPDTAYRFCKRGLGI